MAEVSSIQVLDTAQSTNHTNDAFVNYCCKQMVISLHTLARLIQCQMLLIAHHSMSAIY